MDVLLESTANVTRPPNSRGEEIPTDALLAEHGLCLLVNVYQGEETHTILFDTGYTRLGVLHNMELLEIVPDAIETIVLSHGHMDHTGSLYPLIKKISNPSNIAALLPNSANSGGNALLPVFSRSILIPVIFPVKPVIFAPRTMPAWVPPELLATMIRSQKIFIFSSNGNCV